MTLCAYGTCGGMVTEGRCIRCLRRQPATAPRHTPETEPAVAHLNNALQILQAVDFVSADRKKENVGDIRLTRGEFDSIVARIEKAKAKL